MVHPVGFEPTHLAAPEPESGVYANFTTGASRGKYIKISLPLSTAVSLESPQNFRPAAPLQKRTRRHWVFRRTHSPSIERPNSSFCDLPRNVGFVRGVRLRHRSRPSVASRQTNLDARSGFRRNQGAHPCKAHIRSSITCRRRLPALSRTPPMKAMLTSLRETRIV